MDKFCFTDTAAGRIVWSWNAEARAWIKCAVMSALPQRPA